MEDFKQKLKELHSASQENLNTWFYNASDDQLNQAINLMNSKEILSAYPRQNLKLYIKFSKTLLEGELPNPPDTVALSSKPVYCPYKYSQSCYILRDLIQRLVQFKYHHFFRTCTFLSIFEPSEFIDSRGMKFSTKSTPNKKFTKPLTIFAKILTWKLSQIFTQSFQALKKHSSGLDWKKRFKTRVQISRIKFFCLQQMILKGRINLEQRALWRWRILCSMAEHYGIVNTLKEDVWLLKYLANNANLRYFHCLKRKFETWKEVVCINSTKNNSTHLEFELKSIQKNVELRLIQSLSPVMNLISYTYSETLKKIVSYVQGKAYLMNLIKPNLRNMIHIVQKSTKDALERWRNNTYQSEYIYEYQNYEKTTTLTKQSLNDCKVRYKPVMLLQRKEEKKLSYKLFSRIFKTLWKKKLRKRFKSWKKISKCDFFSISTDSILDLGSFRVSDEDFEKLKVLVNVFIGIWKKRKNMDKLVLSRWMQECYRRILFLAKIKNFAQGARIKRSSCNFAFEVMKAFRRYKNCQQAC